jgi:arginine repressor
MASAVAASLDTFIGHEVVGTIAGDDTLLIITENPESAEEMAGRLRRTFSWKD